MTKTCYFFRLIPIGKFFFGNERTFGQNEEANYFVRSNPFPQQTSLLGMLRFELLKNGKGTFPISSHNKEDVRKRIGERSFSHEIDGKYGIIQLLSPVFLCEGENDVYFPMPNNWHLRQKERFIGQAYRMGQQGEFEELTLPYFPEFNHKNHYSSRFQNLKGDSKKCFQIFVEHGQIGIQKVIENERDTSNKGFYKQFYYTLRAGFSFCFWAEFDEEITWKNPIVYLGADRSAFKIEAKKANWSEDFAQKYTSEIEEGKPITLLSDSYVGDDFYRHCEFSIAEATDFRYIKSDISQTDYSGKSRPKKTDVKLQLLKRGTVIFPNSNIKKLKEQLNNPIFQKVGYNMYKNI